ncbi:MULTISPECIES: hypothetical protein [Nocardia]|uniref:Uncharacterized protein n=1 Tax=Nocardia sputorum TaxID=2984338 RepID=A0ABM8CVJ4_9NOCA|nr:hypothetical protein [Nocardia sputorum]BDT90379.1 hypothetical protein IFM12275_03550 [Nocardia sputorum]BDT98998.1 hypothetical protein IFM12276_20270 [Nocardia sputorum]
MTIKHKITSRARAGWVRLQTLLAGPDEDSRRRTDIGGRRPGGPIERAGRKLRHAFEH